MDIAPIKKNLNKNFCQLCKSTWYVLNNYKVYRNYVKQLNRPRVAMTTPHKKNNKKLNTKNGLNDRQVKFPLLPFAICCVSSIMKK